MSIEHSEHQGSSDESAIEAAIRAAEVEEREIDDATARRIASQLHGGQVSALYSLASTGNLEDERLRHELLDTYNEPTTTPRVRRWIDMLLTYRLHREHRGTVEGWAELTADRPAVPAALGRTGVELASRTHDDQAAAPVDAEHLDTGNEDEDTGPIVVWVESLRDYAHGSARYRVELDATQEPDELEEAIRYMLSRSPTGDGATEWFIDEYFGFSDAVARALGNHPNVEVLSKVAKGIQAHGEAYAAYVSWLGVTTEEQLDKFSEHYRGVWPTWEDYVEHMVDELGYSDAVERALASEPDFPDDLREFVKFDFEELGNAWAQDYHTVEGERGVHVFDAR